MQAVEQEAVYRERAVAKERDSRVEAIEALAKSMSGAGGMYTTEVEQPDRSVIYYIHNAKELSDSTTILQLTSEAFAISIDGGQTYTSGYNFATETAIVNILQATGINADWLDLYGLLTIYKTSAEGSEVGGKIGYTSGNNDFPVQLGMILASALLRGITIVSDNGSYVAYKGKSDFFDSWDGSGEVDISDMVYGRRLAMTDDGTSVQGGLRYTTDDLPDGYEPPGGSLYFPSGDVVILPGSRGEVRVCGALLASSYQTITKTRPGEGSEAPVHYDLDEGFVRNWAYPSEVAGKVSKSGDTMTGSLTMNNVSVIVKDTNVTHNTVPSSNVYGDGFFLRDSAGDSIGYIRTNFMTDGKEGIYIEVVRNVGGTNIYNNLKLMIDASGTRVVSFTDPAAWRSGLGLGSIATINKGTSTTTYLRNDGTWATPPDTNTWRGIQNNLTSTSTTDSLSAAQGKALNDKITGLVKTGTYSGTTTASGNLSDISSKPIIGVTANGNRMGVPYKQSSGNNWGIHFFTAGTEAAVKSTAVSGTYYYLNI